MKKNDRLFILVYHDIISDEEKPQLSNLSITLSRFNKHMKYVKEHYVVTSLGKIIRNYKNDEEIEGQIAITFDDAYKGVFLYGLPILEKYNFTATFFIPTSYIGKSHQYMSWDDIKILSNRGHEIGSHTITHRNLAELKPHEVEKEVINSKIIIERKLGINVTLFAYPFGKKDNITKKALQIVKRAGYECCCSTTGFLGISKKDLNPYMLERTPINNMSMFLFKKTLKASGWLNIIEKTERKLRKFIKPSLNSLFASRIRLLLYKHVGY